MKNWSIKKKVGIGLLFLGIAAQAIRPEKNNAASFGPEDISKAVIIPDTILSILKASCFDCHSNHTNYPWYNNLAPVSWWVAFHVEEGKAALNFSTFSQYTTGRQTETLEAITESVKYNRMPLSSYLFMHKDAQLTAQQKAMIINWAKEAMDIVMQKR